VHFDDADRRGLLGYHAAPQLDREAVARYALGELVLAESILAPFRAAPFESIWTNLARLALPALAVEVRRGPPTGRSKLGGLPDLPPRTDWPRRGQKPLAFIAQLDLSEVGAYVRDPVLPTTGLLSFFYEADLWTSGNSPDDRGAWRVLLSTAQLVSQSPPALAPGAAPQGYDPATWGFEEAGVAFVPRISLPEAEHILTERLGVGPDDYQAYNALMDELRQAHSLAGLTQVLGYPAEIQHDPFVTCQVASHGLEPQTSDDWKSDELIRLLDAREAWRLLLQVDSISEIGMEWADSGLLYFSMRDGDLRTRQWDKSWLLMESL
jgi:Domain of unknown function (DUF1963)